MRPRSSIFRLLGLGLGLGFGLVFSTGCTREKKVERQAVEPPPPAPVVHEHVPLTAFGSTEGAAVVLAKLEGRTLAYVADEDDAAVRAVDLESREELARTPLAGRPGQMLVGKDGRLYVALRDDQAVVALAATKDLRAPLDDAGRADTAVEPIGLALTPDESTLLVVSGWGHALETFAMPSLERKLAVDLEREPRAVTVSSDGKTAFVAHASTGHMSTIALDADRADRAAARIGLGTPRITTRRSAMPGPTLLFKLELDSALEGDPPEHHFICGTAMLARMRVTIPERFGRQGYALAKYKDDKGELILAPQMTMATGDALVTSSGYGGGGIDEELSIATEEFEVASIDVSAKKRTVKNNGLPPKARSGKDACRLPRAALADPSRRSLFVSCLGVDKVIEYDTGGSVVKNAFDVPSGPVGIAADEGGKRLAVWSAFDRTLSLLTLPEPVKETKAGAKKAKNAEPPKIELTKIALSAPMAPLAPEVALGRKLFHKGSEPKISKDGRACASCHPDGREDGLVWSTPEGPRQTIMLAGRVAREAPFGWLGKHTTIKEHMTITMRNLKGTGVSDSEFDALASYLRTMKPPPRAKSTSLSAQAEHGRELFNSSTLACASCHAEKSGFSDHEVHDVASATASDTQRQFLVPSLRFVAGSAPYFHDGRYASLEDLLAKNQRMGDTKSLSTADRDALAAYLRTL